MTRRYGRAPRGERVREGTPAGHWHTLTLLGAITVDGLLASMSVESPTDTEVFLAYLQQVLCPRLRPGQVVVMDNLSANIAAANAFFSGHNMEAVYLPTNASWLNAIESEFTSLHADTIKNSDDDNHQRRRRRIYRYLRWRNRQHGSSRTYLARFMR